VGKFYVTTPIYYVNDVPHIGTAYPTIAADIAARFHRMMGDDVLFSTGTDENATKVSRVAQQRGEDPRAFVDKMAAAFEETWQRMHISYDDFVRTTEPRHHKAVQTLIELLYERGDIYYSEYEGWYCIPCETHFVEGQLQDGKCPDCGRDVEHMVEPGYFFRLSKYAQPLLDYIEAHPDWLQPEFRKNEAVQFIKGGLRDQYVTRKSEWGIPVPASLPNSEGLVIYVWYDAVINYITVPGFPDDMGRFNCWWPVDSQIVGKDIFTRFHATLWPAMLMAAGLPVQETVVAHGFWTIGGEKISKSKHSGKGFRINPLDLAEEIVNSSGANIDVAIDAVRYFAMREMPFGSDGDFSLEALFRRYNSDLANDLGNLLNRSVTMLGRYCNGIVPAPAPVLPEAEHAARQVEALLGGRHIEYMEALKSVWELLNYLNRYIEEQAPWKLFKAGKQEEVDAVMYTLVEGLRFAAVMLYPFTPFIAERIAEQIGWAKPDWAWSSLAWGLLPQGAQTQPAGPLVPRIVEKAEGEQPAAPAPKAEAQPVPPAPKAEEKPAPQAEEQPAAPELITIDDFAKVRLKAGTIIAAEKHPKADKLVILQVDLGEEQPRQIVAGIAAFYPPETLVGRQIVVVANLQPAKLRGEVSQGMLLAADMGETGMSVLMPDQPVPNGSKVR